MALNVRKILGLVILVNLATFATFFYLTNSQNPSSDLPATVSNKQESERGDKHSSRLRQQDKPNRTEKSRNSNAINLPKIEVANSDIPQDTTAGFTIDLNVISIDHNDNKNGDMADNKQNQPSRVQTNGSSSPQKSHIVGDRPSNDAIIRLAKKYKGLNESLGIYQERTSNTNPFRKFGYYKEIDSEFFEESKKGKPFYDSPHSGLKKNPGYCDYADLYNYFNPSNVFDQMNFISDFASDLVRKDVISKTGTDLMPQIRIVMEGYRDPLYDLDIKATMFFTKKVDFHFYHELGAAQLYNHIPGSRVLTHKSLLAGSVNDYYQTYGSKPHCFNKSMLFPYSYRLDNANECAQFFNEINEESYFTAKKQHPINYLLKEGYGKHKTEGVQLFDDVEEQKLRRRYLNGSICGTIQETRLVQKYIQNPLLLDQQNKFDIRAYMLVASVNPLIVYYHDGFLRVSLEAYDADSSDKSAHLSSAHLNNIKVSTIMNRTLAAELDKYQTWTLSQLEAFLHKARKIPDFNWIESYLRPAMKKALIHLVKMSSHGFWNHSGVFEMFGVDFMLDDDLNLWLLEVNGSPKLVGNSALNDQAFIELLKEMLEIEYAYLRSKMKRLFGVVGKYFTQLHAKTEINITPEDKEAFVKATKNSLEPEFTLRSGMFWQKVLDESLPGKAAYMGLLEDECVLE